MNHSFPYSLFHYKFTASQVIEGFSFSYLFFYLAFDISTYITTIHQGEKKNKNLKKEKKNKKMSCHVGKPKPFFLIHLINLHISQKVDHLSKKKCIYIYIYNYLFLNIINLASFSMILNNPK